MSDRKKVIAERKQRKDYQVKRQEWLNYLILNVAQNDRVIFGRFIHRFIAIDEQNFMAIIYHNGAYIPVSIMDISIPA